jgi:ferrous iron transport protein B
LLEWIKRLRAQGTHEPVHRLAGGCHALREPAPAAADTLRVALVGLPNTGKSTLYNRLTGGQAQIANWPGLTVDLLRGDLPPGPDGRRWELIDLPGIHDLSGASPPQASKNGGREKKASEDGASEACASEDEAIVLRLLATAPPDLLLVVVNASQVDRQLRLVLQLQTLGLPVLLALNMSDEAQRFGVRIDAERLAAMLGLAVVPISARHGQGIDLLLEAIHRADTARKHPTGPDAGSGDPPAGAAALEARRQQLVAECVRLPGQPPRQGSRRIDAVLLHPLVGPVLFLAIVLAMFQAIYALGVPLQDGMEALFATIRSQLILPGLTAAGAPTLMRSFLVDGLWLGITTVASFLPIIFLFYLLLAVVEDSGYLPRAAFLMDGLMHWLGLDGRAFVLQMMGFGCNVPAIMGTRVIRDPAMRLLAMLLIPFALCQARLTVFVFMAGIFFPRPWWAPGLVVFGFYVLSFVAAILTGLIFKRAYPSREAFVLELPPYRTPSLHTMLRRAWREMTNFMVTTRSFIVIGAALVWVLTTLPAGATQASDTTFAHAIGNVFQPLLGPIGMTPDLSVSLFFGFIAKEILLGAMAVIHHTSEAGLGAAIQAAITPLQALSFMTFVLLYTPCLSTVAVQLKESGSRAFVLRSVAWSLTLAWVMALLVYQGGRLLMGAYLS